jgi:hypothetical protein
LRDERATMGEIRKDGERERERGRKREGEMGRERHR